MPWWETALLLFAILAVLFAIGVPVAFSFLLLLIIGGFMFWGTNGLTLVISSMYDSVATFNLLPVPLFVLMGEILFQSGMGFQLLDAIDKWVGKLPGRLSLVAVAGGTVVGTLSGSSMASAALLGTVLMPEMEKRGYQKPMLLGPTMGAGGLATIIPPSGLAVLLGSVAAIPIGPLLISGFIPGLLLATFYASYIILRSWLQPSIAPPYIAPSHSFMEKVTYTAKYLLPFAIIIFLVMGLILLGVATPTESAAMGTLGSFILAIAYRRLTWDVIKKSVFGGLQVTVMMFMIFTGSRGFSQILAFSGASRGIVDFATSLPLTPIMLLIVMQLILVVLGCLMDPVSMLMISMPIYMPIVQLLGFDLVWFGLLVLINLELAGKTPPFGFLLFLMKGISPPDTTMGDIYRSVTPFVLMELVTMGLIMAFPSLGLWLPSLMRQG
ncbi:MAG: TRAP transporter large permease subunit [Chloroflexota bacterium]